MSIHSKRGVRLRTTREFNFPLKSKEPSDTATVLTDITCGCATGSAFRGVSGFFSPLRFHGTNNVANGKNLTDMFSEAFS